MLPDTTSPKYNQERNRSFSVDSARFRHLFAGRPQKIGQRQESYPFFCEGRWSSREVKASEDACENVTTKQRHGTGCIACRPHELLLVSVRGWGRRISSKSGGFPGH